MKILFITEKYHHHTAPSYGMTNNMHNLIGSYESTGLGEYQHCFIAPEHIWSTQGIDEALLTNTYDVAVISVYHHLPSWHVAQQIGHKTVMCWWDAIISLDGVRHWANAIHQLIFDHGKGQEYPNCFALSMPEDPRLFYKDNTPEDIDVSFVGSIDAPRPDRAQVLALLEGHGWNVWAGGGRGEGLTNLSIEEYANIFRRSKICLNLSYGHGRPQRKGRPFETAACGKFMLSNCPEILSGKEGSWFEDGIDYASFDNNNLIEKIKHFLEHEEERKKISDNMHKKYLENYTATHFWKNVLAICL